MSAETDLYTMLSTGPALASLVGSRIYPDALPEKCAYPAVIFSRAGTEPVNTIHSTSAGAFVSFSISGWARSRAEADAVADAIEEALNTAGEVITGRLGGYDEELELQGCIIDTTVFSA